MPKKLQKSLQDYLTKIKNPTPQIQFSSGSLSSSKNWILSGCKHPKTLSFAIDDGDKNKSGNNDGGGSGGNNSAATLSDIDRFLLENFKSLYVEDGEDENEKKGKKEISHEGENPSPGGHLFESPRFIDLPRDLCGSQRFFVDRGSSGSLIDESRTSVATTFEEAGSTSTTTTTLNDSTSTSDDHGKDVTLPDDCIAVLAHSPSPYDDFRRSMEEMVDARMRNHGNVDWDFMEELLFCFLNLNEKKSYRYILSAFVDLIVVLRQNSGRVPVRSRNVHRNTRIGERQRRRKMREK